MIGERSVDDELKERLVRIETLLEANNKELFNRIKNLESNQNWIIKTVIGTVIVGVINLYF